MPDDKRKTGKRDRSRVATDQAYEVNYFARRHPLTKAEKIIRKARGNRDKANQLTKAGGLVDQLPLSLPQ